MIGFIHFVGLLLLSATATATQCAHKVNGTSSPWTKNQNIKNVFLSEGRTPKIPDTVTVNLDLPPEERWVHVGETYANRSHLIIDYFESAIPAWAVGILAKIGDEVVDYRGFGEQFSGEMKGYAKGLGIDLGYVVLANLVYQIESIGVNCSNWNATGPTNACKNASMEQPLVWLESELSRLHRDDVVQTGYCTSVVADNAAGEVVHGRNLDWNLPEEVRELVVNVDFERNGTLLYKGTSIVSFVGLLNGMRPGGYSFSMDARCQGGKLFLNLLEALALGAMTPCHHSRTVMESAATFDDAVKGWQDGKLIDDGYFIIGGVNAGEGAVVSRDRNRAADTWYIQQNVDRGAWYVLETNYDHWDTPPAADDRRTPGNDNMNKLGVDGMSPSRLYQDVMTVWPTFNPHTDVTCIMSAKDAVYNCSVWHGD